jgi:hypothetical protein
MPDDPFADRPAPSIHIFRGQRVVLDAEVAALFGVETRRLNEQVRRNGDRFGEDFAFQLTPGETADLISQNATSSAHGGRRKPPLVFTEHGTVMAAEALDAEITARQVETEHRRLALIAKQLRIAIEVQRFLDTGSAEGLMTVLRDLGAA